MTDLLIKPASRGLRGVVRLPSDKSVTHRGILFASLAEGESRIRATRLGADHRSTIEVLTKLGVSIEVGETEILVRGKGLQGFVAPTEPLDCGNSGTTMRLMAGLIVAQPFTSTLVGDASLMKRPMARVAVPLRQRGGRIEGKLDPRKPGELTAPLVIGPLPPPNILSALHFDMSIASAQVKTAILLSGLYSDGQTIVSEPVISRDHTERMLTSLGVPLERMANVVSLAPFDGRLPPFELTPPGDPSAAAFILGAGLIVPGSEVGAQGVGLNPTRLGFFEAVRWMGAQIAWTFEGEDVGEPFGIVRAVSSSLRGVTFGGELVTRAIDEVPILAAVAARAHGETTITDASELRVKESDRIAATLAMLRAFGVTCAEQADGLIVRGRPEGPLEAAVVDSMGDHRIAMSAAVLGLAGNGVTRVLNVDNIATSFPKFVGTLRALGADVSVG